MSVRTYFEDQLFFVTIAPLIGPLSDVNVVASESVQYITKHEVNVFDASVLDEVLSTPVLFGPFVCSQVILPSFEHFVCVHTSDRIAERAVGPREPRLIGTQAVCEIAPKHTFGTE